MMKCLVIGISGITGAGKTTLASSLYAYLSDPKNIKLFETRKISKVHLIHQDKYFYARDSPNHIWIPEINFINREILSAMDMKRFVNDIQTLYFELNSSDKINFDSDRNLNILIVEGFLIFNETKINDLCNIRFHLFVSYDEGFKRRLTRTFKHINPQPEWYWENYIWPSYQKHLNELPNKNELIFINGEQSVDVCFDEVIKTIRRFEPQLITISKIVD